MAIVAALSTRNIASVSAQVNALSEFYLPLQRAVGEARLSGAQQVINLERMLHTQSVERELVERLRERELPDVVDARQHLHLTTLKYLQELDTGDRKATQLFRDVVGEERERLAKEAAAAAALVQSLVESSAATANV